MKHKKTAVCTALLALLLAAVTTLFAGCSAAVYATVRAGWQTNTAFTTNFKEELTYSLSFDPANDSTEAGWVIDIDEENSSYTESIEALPSGWRIPSEEGEPLNPLHLNVYHLRTEATIAATYSFREADGADAEEIVSFGAGTDTEADIAVTDVYFHSLTAADGEEQHALEPIYSVTTVRSHSPIGFASANINWFSYTYTTVYNAAGTEATITYQDNWEIENEEDRVVGEYIRKSSYSPEDLKKELSGLRGSYSAFDAAQLFFAARGLTYAEGSSETVTVVSPATGAQNYTIACAERADISCGFLLSSKNVAAGNVTVSNYVSRDIYAAEVSFSLASGGNSSGEARTVYYAQENGYYNVPLRMEIPFGYSVGTVVYSLTSLFHAE